MKLIKIILFLFLLIPLVNANGLMVNQTSIYVNKTVNINEPIILTITNSEPFTFHNLTFKSNPYITMSKIESLGSGSSVSIISNVIYNQDVETNVRLIGYYLAQIGQTNKEYPISISFPNGGNKCDLTLIKGDRILFKNNVDDEILVKNADNLGIIATLLPNSNLSVSFDVPQEINYYYDRRSYHFPIGTNCKITVLNDNGMVNNPDLDAVINLKISANYEPTLLYLDIPQTSYSMNITDSNDGVMTLTNIGNKNAYNVKLEGSWITFSTNNFNLNVGQSKGIIYTIHPLITSTEETNKSYNISIKANGNFPEIKKDLIIFINYAEISNSSGSGTSLIDFLINYCNLNPTLDICSPKVIYKYRDDSQQNVTFNVPQEQVNDLFGLIFQAFDEMKRGENMHGKNMVKCKLRDFNIFADCIMFSCRIIYLSKIMD